MNLMETRKSTAKPQVKKISVKEQRLMAIVRYILGGVLTYGLLGFLLSWLFSIWWLWILGVLLGAAGGFYLVHKHGLLKESL